MEYLFKRVLAIGHSAQHALSFSYSSDVGYSMYIHEADRENVADSVHSYANSQDEIIAFLDKWAELIAKEREHDEAVNASEGRMDS